jgi:RNA polymerase sigma-B factor
MTIVDHASPEILDQASPETAERAQAAGDLAVEYLSVADALAKRYRCPGHDAEDLRQVARMGLIKAAHRYRSGEGNGFVAYAVPTITGELKRYLRDQAWTVRPPRSIQELRLRVRSTVPDLTQRLGHEPTAQEISGELGYQQIEPTDSTEDRDVYPLGAVMAFHETGYETVEANIALSSALEGVSEGDKRLLYLRFVKEMSQQQIADELGVSQMQVSRLLRRLLDRLRRRMAA